ncbi:hypothetical protein V5799_018482 [Amblyomma americanum]|uniref:Uncharacterized protein n=1 Tax=Amblyomma americanum TaxID=6943 RepID=A0AAQ4F0C6_AMBAM
MGRSRSRSRSRSPKLVRHKNKRPRKRSHSRGRSRDSVSRAGAKFNDRRPSYVSAQRLRMPYGRMKPARFSEAVIVGVEQQQRRHRRPFGLGQAQSEEVVGRRQRIRFRAPEAAA